MYNGNSSVGNNYEANSAPAISYSSDSADPGYNGNSLVVSYSSNSAADSRLESESESEFDQLIEEEAPKYQRNKGSDIAFASQQPNQTAQNDSQNHDQPKLDQNFFVNKELQDRDIDKETPVVESIEEMISRAIENAVSK